MPIQAVSNAALGSYPVLVDKNSINAEMQVMRLDIGVGDAESRVSSSNPLPVSMSGAGSTVPTAIGTLTESNPTVTTSSTQTLAANASRKGGYLVNISDTDIYVSFGATATTSKQLVQANGGSIPFVISNQVYTGAINSIHAGSGTKTILAVQLT